jgi:hypothetical protein
VRGTAQLEYWQFNVDEVIGAWMQALGAMARTATSEKAAVRASEHGSGTASESASGKRSRK